MAALEFSIAATAFDVSLLPEAARTHGTPAFREAVSAFLQSEFRDFGGHANIRVDDQAITVSWDPATRQSNPLPPIIQKLQQGRHAEGIQLLEMLLTHRPKDTVLLYNLGLALSDTGRLERAEHCLRRAAALEPEDANIAVALGVALGRMGRTTEAIPVLRGAVERDGKNPWAQRNLGGLLLQEGKAEEALGHFQQATRLLSQDQLAWLGLADACRLTNRVKEAEVAYRQAVEINPHSDLAERARAGSNALAQAGYEHSRQAVVRQDVLHYCMDALQRLSGLPLAELQKLSLELAMAGRNGFEVHNPDSRYRVKGLPGEYSGLAMVCFLYVAMQRIRPGTDIGFDVHEEYAAAKKMLGKQG